VTWDGSTVIASAVSDSQLSASIPSALVTVGTHQVRVVNPGGVASEIRTVNVGNPLSITTASLPDGIVGQAYPSTRVLAIGGSSLTWSLLPDIGLRIDPSTGVIQGTPTVVGANDLSVTVQDTLSTLTATRTYSIRVLPPVSVSLSGLSVSIDLRQN